jgi:hypothetical protein
MLRPRIETTSDIEHTVRTDLSDIGPIPSGIADPTIERGPVNKLPFARRTIRGGILKAWLLKMLNRSEDGIRRLTTDKSWR